MNYTLFADDGTTSLSTSFKDEAIEALRTAQSDAKDWFDANELLLNEERTKMMLFAMGDIGITTANMVSVRYLGTLPFIEEMAQSFQQNGVSYRDDSERLGRNLCGAALLIVFPLVICKQHIIHYSTMT